MFQNLLVSFQSLVEVLAKEEGFIILIILCLEVFDVDPAPIEHEELFELILFGFEFLEFPDSELDIQHVCLFVGMHQIFQYQELIVRVSDLIPFSQVFQPFKRVVVSYFLVVVNDRNSVHVNGAAEFGNARLN